MEVRVMIGTHEATVTVANEDEAVSFLAKLSLRLDGDLRLQQHASAPAIMATTPAADSTDGSADEDSIRKALMLMRGKPSGRLLQMIAATEEGCTDLVVKKEMSDGAGGREYNLGPVFAHLSRCCKKFNVDKSAVLYKKAKRLRRGKMSYFYRVTDVAARLIRETPDFNEEPDWDALEGFE